MENKEFIKGEKFEESYRGTKNQLKEFIRKYVLRLFADKLYVEGERVIIPNDRELNYKIKYDVEDNYSIAIKIYWKNPNIEIGEIDDFYGNDDENEDI